MEKVFVTETLKVRFSDLDASGHLNHAAALTFIEQARLKYYADVLDLKLPGDLTGWALVRLEVNYRVPGWLGNDLRAEVRVPWVKTSSAGWEFRLVRDGDDAVILDGSAIQVHLDATSGAKETIPHAYRERIRALDPSVEIAQSA